MPPDFPPRNPYIAGKALGDEHSFFGRKAEDLSIDIKATFKAARYQRISVLDEESARSLVRLAEGEGSIEFTTAAIDRLLSLTARHPYLTQLMCHCSSTLHTPPYRVVVE